MSAGSPSPGSARRTRRVMALITPEAGRGDVERVREAIAGGLEGAGAEIEFIELGGERRAGELAARAVREGFDLVLAAGGDGTVAQVSSGLLGSTVPLGIIPVGTGNIVALNLGIPLSPREAARAACFGSATRYDVGRTDDGRLVILAVGAGYDADLFRDADRELKRRFGPLAYLFAMFKNLYVRRARYVVELDRRERIHVHAKSVLVTNVGRTLGSIPLAPDASVNDGRLDVVIFSFAGFGQLLLLFLKAVVGRLKHDPRVRFYQARHIRISASRPIPVQVDGEAIPRTTPIEVEVASEPLYIVRPPARPSIDFAGLAESALKAMRIPGRKPEEARDGESRGGSAGGAAARTGISPSSSPPAANSSPD